MVVLLELLSLMPVLVASVMLLSKRAAGEVLTTSERKGAPLRQRISSRCGEWQEGCRLNAPWWCRGQGQWLHEVDGRDGVDVGGREDGLVAAAVATAVDVGMAAGHVTAAAGGATAVAVVAR